jgi:hypothetical protein
MYANDHLDDNKYINGLNGAIFYGKKTQNCNIKLAIYINNFFYSSIVRKKIQKPNSNN